MPSARSWAWWRNLPSEARAVSRACAARSLMAELLGSSCPVVRRRLGRRISPEDRCSRGSRRRQACHPLGQSLWNASRIVVPKCNYKIHTGSNTSSPADTSPPPERGGLRAATHFHDPDEHRSVQCALLAKIRTFTTSSTH